MDQVAEGIKTTHAAVTVAESLGVDMPIARVTKAVLDGELDPQAAIEGLMTSAFSVCEDIGDCSLQALKLMANPANKAATLKDERILLTGFILLLPMMVNKFLFGPCIGKGNAKPLGAHFPEKR